MPIVSLNTPTALSSAWTPARLIHYIRSLVHELDNERIQDADIRTHLNDAVSYVVEALSLALSPHYGIQWGAKIDAAQTTGSPTSISLVTVAGGLVPIQHLARVIRLTCENYGECTEMMLEEIITLSTDLNTKFQQSVCWVWHGEEILVYVGPRLRTGITETSSFTVWGYRQPVMDDLLPPTQSQTLHTQIDVPNRVVPLVRALGQKACLEQLGKAIPVEVTALINQMLGNTSKQSTQSNIARRA